MILPITILFGAIGYLVYTSKKEVLLDHNVTSEDSIENDDLYKDLEDLFI